MFDDVSFTVGRGETFLVLGLNGAGKTTLLRTVAGARRADAGDVRFGANVGVGFYAQEHEDIRAGVSVLDHLRERADLPEKDLRAVLGHFGLTGDAALQDAATLSGGEKTKLALARLVVSRSNLLLLDEPTNNLDPRTRSGARRPTALRRDDRPRQPRHRVRRRAGARPVVVMPEVTCSPSTTAPSTSSRWRNRRRPSGVQREGADARDELVAFGRVEHEVGPLDQPARQRFSLGPARPAAAQSRAG